MSRKHLIRFRTRKDHREGLMTVLGVPGLEAVGLPDYRMVVWDEHIRALEQAKVRFEYLSQPAANGPDSSAPRSL